MALIRNTSDLPAVLRTRRIETGTSIQSLARLIGVSRSTVTRIENGQLNPTWSLVLAISQAIDLQPVLVPRDRLPAVEAVMKMSQASEAPPLAGDEWD